MEELKMEQEMRERRSSDRDRGRESWHKGNSSVKISTFLIAFLSLSVIV
jgi:hypothetical protein